MQLKGFEKFREKTPALKGIRIVLIPIYVFFVLIITSYVLKAFYTYPGILKQKQSIIPFLIPLIGVVLVELIGFFLLSQMWIWRDTLKKKYGPGAYQRILLIGLAGITIIIYLAFNNYSSLRNYAPAFWTTNEYSILIRPWYMIFGKQIKSLIVEIKLILDYLFLLLGFSMSIRSIYTFGLDYTTAVYLYFPEESTIQENKIYSILRHPMYNGLVFVAMGGFFFNLTVYSLIFCILYILGFYFHIHYVEEKELLSRFGESYKTYRKKVPMFCMNPLKLSMLIKFIVTG